MGNIGKKRHVTSRHQNFTEFSGNVYHFDIVLCCKFGVSTVIYLEDMSNFIFSGFGKGYIGKSHLLVRIMTSRDHG